MENIGALLAQEDAWGPDLAKERSTVDEELRRSRKLTLVCSRKLTHPS
jgi:hypothetical protein